MDVESRYRPPRVVMPGAVPALIMIVACIALLFDHTQMRAPSAAAVTAILLVLLSYANRVARARASLTVLAESEARFRALVQYSTDVTMIITRDGMIRYASPATINLFGVQPAEIEGQALAALVHPDDAGAIGRFLRAVSQGESVVVEWRMRGEEERWIWTENTSFDMSDEPAIGGLVMNCRDISERRSLESKLTHQAYHDALTRLANRALFHNRVAHAIARRARGRRLSAVLFLDLDDFKKVNDSLGHAAGDQLLIACAERLTTCIRPGDTIARMGGDEFAVLLEDLDDMSGAVQIAERIGASLRSPVPVQGRDVFVGVSIGIAAISPDQAPDEVMRNADLAMYFAKAREKGQYAIYAPTMHAQLLDRLELEADLRGAVDAGSIGVAFQPIFNLMTGELYGAEALLRWRHPSRGNVAPSRFVSIAEETGLIVPIGRTILMEACGRAHEWRMRRPTATQLRMAVNLSGRHFQDDTLLRDVQDALAVTGLEPGALTLEITESVLMQRSENTLDTLRALKALGVSLAIDDFGTGYSSLGYLQQFPIDTLKIDRSFVEAVGQPGVEPVLVKAILGLGRTLGIDAIAEGIERREQLDGLRLLGCQLGQGFFFAEPMPAEEFGRTLVNAGSPPSVLEMYGLRTPPPSTVVRARGRAPTPAP